MNKILENIIHKLIYTCEKATYLIEIKASGHPLNALESIRLKGHLAICKWCKAYEKKVDIIDQAMIRISEKSNDSLMESEIKELKNDLKENF